MTLQQLASIDLNTLTKEQLKSYAKEAREEWGKAIDLRSAKEPDLIEYLQMFLDWKVTQEVTEIEAVTPEPVVTTPNIEEFTTVNDVPEPKMETLHPLLYRRLCALAAHRLSNSVEFNRSQVTAAILPG
jgi:hypothetical protein